MSELPLTRSTLSIRDADAERPVADHEGSFAQGLLIAVFLSLGGWAVFYLLLHR